MIGDVLVEFCLWKRFNYPSSIHISAVRLIISTDYRHIYDTWNCIYGRHYVGLHHWCWQCRCFEGKDSHHGGIMYTITFTDFSWIIHGSSHEWATDSRSPCLWPSHQSTYVENSCTVEDARDYGHTHLSEVISPMPFYLPSFLAS